MIAALVARLQTRLRRRDLLWSLAAAGAALAAIATTGRVTAPGRWLAAAVAVPTALVWLVARRSRDRWTPAAVAALIESRVGALDNLVVTAVELDRWPERASRTMREEVERQAASRAALVSSSAVVPMRGASAVCGIVCASAAGVLWSALASSPPAPDGIRHATGPPAIERVAVGVSPPAYLRRPVTTVEGAGPVAVPAGSLVRLEVVSRQPRVWVEDPASGTTALASRGVGRFEMVWTATTSRSLAVSAGDESGAAADSRLLLVTPPARPSNPTPSRSRSAGAMRSPARASRCRPRIDATRSASRW